MHNKNNFFDDDDDTNVYTVRLISASPPRHVSMEEIMKAARGVGNMALAHEIAVDNDFKIEPEKLPDNR